jgi:hypothetical protein
MSERRRLIAQCEPLSGRLQLSRDGSSALFHPVADHVDRVAAIKPGRDRATDPRLQFAASATVRSKWGATGFIDFWNAILPEILGEIDRAFVPVRYRLDRSPFRIDRVVAFEPDVKEFEFVSIKRPVAPDRRAVDHGSGRYQQAVDKQGVVLPHAEHRARAPSGRPEPATPHPPKAVKDRSS